MTTCRSIIQSQCDYCGSAFAPRSNAKQRFCTRACWCASFEQVLADESCDLETPPPSHWGVQVRNGNSTSEACGVFLTFGLVVLRVCLEAA